MGSVKVAIDGSQIEAHASTDPKKYTVDLPAPAKVGSYSFDVSITDSLGQTVNKTNVGNITVVEKPAEVIKNPAFQDVKIVTEGDRATFQFSVVNPPEDLDKFKIAYGTNADSFSNESVTYASGKIYKNGAYTWYIDKLQPKMYYFKIFGVKTDGSLSNQLVSEIQSITVGSKGTCSVGNV
jgi:hypothetical protein